MTKTKESSFRFRLLLAIGVVCLILGGAVANSVFNGPEEIVIAPGQDYFYETPGELL